VDDKCNEDFDVKNQKDELKIYSYEEGVFLSKELDGHPEIFERVPTR
jgi:hypothetical protein